MAGRLRVRTCPGCDSTNVRASRAANLFEELLMLLFIRPFRCRDCRHRFWRLR